VQTHNSADDDDRGNLNINRRRPCHLPQRRHQNRLCGCGCLADDGHRLIGSPSGFQQPLGDFHQMPRRHVEHENRGASGDGIPIEPPGNVAIAVVTGQESDRRIGIAMGDRDSGISRSADPGGNSGHDTERDAGARERQRLLSAAPEHAGIPALQAQDAVAGLRQANQPGRDVRLARRGAAAALARIVERRAGPRQAQDSRIDQRVISDNVSARERMQRQCGEQSRVTGSGPDEPYAARFKPRQAEKGAVDHSETTSENTPTCGRCTRAELAVGLSACQKVVILIGFAKIGLWHRK